MARPRRIAVQMGLDQPFKRHTFVFAGIQKYALERDDWRLIIDEWADHTLPTKGDKPAPYDGLIGRISAQGARRARRLNLPVVNVWFSSPARDVPGVFPDVAAAGQLVAEHLLSRGFRSFGVICCQSFRASMVETESFEKTVRDAGCTDIRKLVLSTAANSPNGTRENFQQWQAIVRAIEGFLDGLRPPVGLTIIDIWIARLVVELCRHRGWWIPEDVAIVAGSNEEINCEHPQPGITSMEEPFELIGYRAAQLLDQLMNEKEKKKRKHSDQGTPAAQAQTILLPPVGIVARRSTDFFAVDDATLRGVLRYIDENLQKPLSIDELANVADISRSTLTNLFREKLGRGVAAEIQRLRIERVKRALVASDQPIQDIAREVGFASPRTLNDAFHSEVGCTPRAYRRQWSPVKTGS